MGNTLGTQNIPRDITFHVLNFVVWSDVAGTCSVNRNISSILQDDAFWALMCRRLSWGNGLYVSCAPAAGSWKDYFFDLWPHRHCWHTSAGENSLRFSIGVSVRLRNGKTVETAQVEDVVLPLHQRLQAIRALHRCDAREAQRRLWASHRSEAQGSRDPFACAVMTAEGRRSGPNSRDVSDDEDAQATDVSGTKVGILSVNPKEILLCAPGCGIRQFGFDCVMDENTQQDEVYDAAARGVITDFLNGVNGCIFCYGQTGSGKTFTMFGPDETSSTIVTRVQAGAGIVPRACAEVIRAVQQRQAEGITAELGVSIVENYGDALIDLLHEGTIVGNWAGVAARAVLEGSAKEVVHTEEDLEQLLIQAESKKRRAATAMNERSSRAHTLLLMFLDQRRDGCSLSSQLCLADLGGSEQLKKSKATGQRVEEAVNINLGLLALNKCITALREGASHVPYQDSRLTGLLAGSLGGSARTVVIVTAATSPEHAGETLQALRFGERCSQVEEKEGKRGFRLRDAIEALDREIAEVEGLIKANERWETRRVVRSDADGDEVLLTTVPVGAEEERERLAALLERRRALIGA